MRRATKFDAAPINRLRGRIRRQCLLCQPIAELASLLLIDPPMTVPLFLLSPIRATLFTALAPMGLGAPACRRGLAPIWYCGKRGIISEERCPTVSGQVSSELDKVMVICKNELASICGSFASQKPSGTLRTGESTLSETTLGEPISHVFRSREWFTAGSQLLRVQYRIFQRHIAKFCCNFTDVMWIGPHCAEAK